MSAAGRPRTAYLVCTTPRTGSGLLGEALWNTGVAGRPDEYVNDGTMREYMTAWSVSDRAAYLPAALAYATTPNGVAGLKLMAKDLAALRLFLPDARRRDAFGGLDALAAMLPSCRFVFLTRQDRVRQAVSLWRATSAGAFASTTAAATSAADRLGAAFDVRAVDRHLAAIDGWNATWRAFFRSRRVDPLRLVYEDDLQDDYAGAVVRVLAAVGVAPNGPPPAVTRRPQTDALSDLLVERYRAARPDR